MNCIGSQQGIILCFINVFHNMKRKEERKPISPLLVWGPCLRGQQGLLPGSGVRGGLDGRESGTLHTPASCSLAMCFAVCFPACKCCTAAAAVHNCLQYGAVAQLSAIRDWGPLQRPVMITATCQVAGTTGASHYLPSYAPPSQFCPICQN